MGSMCLEHATIVSVGTLSEFSLQNVVGGGGGRYQMCDNRGLEGVGCISQS